MGLAGAVRRAALLAVVVVAGTLAAAAGAPADELFTLRGAVQLGGTKTAVRPENVRVVLSRGGGMGRETAFLMNDGSFEIDGLEEGQFGARPARPLQPPSAKETAPLGARFSSR